MDSARKKLAAEGKEAFVIGAHYGVTSQLAFHLQDNRTKIFCLTSEQAENQFYFWPGYTNRHGQNAIFVCVLGNVSRTPMELAGDIFFNKAVTPEPQHAKPPEQLTKEFASVRDAGLFPVQYRSRTLRWVQIFECRDLR